MANYLRGRRSRGEPFIRTVADLHFLLFLSNLLDMSTEMPVLCSTWALNSVVRWGSPPRGAQLGAGLRGPSLVGPKS